MQSLTRLLGAALVAVGLLAGVLLVRPAWLSDAGLDFWELPGLYADLENSNREMDDLTQRQKALFHRLTTRQEVLRALRADSLSLIEAAARFGQVNREEPETMSYVREMYPGNSDEERVCRQVLAWARADLSGDPGKGRATLLRLEAELEAYLRQHESAR
jgi:hypothetical protein